VEQKLRLDKYIEDQECTGDTDCKNKNYRAVRGYLYAIGDVGIGNVVRALLISWGKLFLTGGVSQLGRYMDIGDTTDLYDFMSDGRSFGQEMQRVASSFELSQVWFVALLILAVGFSEVCRVLGLIGVIVSIRDKSTIRYTVFYLGTIGTLNLAILLNKYITRKIPIVPR
jgi:hypothetical protein